MKFNDLFDKILEDFNAPVDTNKKSKALPGKFTNQNPQLGKPHDSKTVTGFKGQPGGKINTVLIRMKKKKSEDGEALDKLTSKEHPAMKKIKNKDLSSQFSPGVKNTLTSVFDDILKDRSKKPS